MKIIKEGDDRIRVIREKSDAGTSFSLIPPLVGVGIYDSECKFSYNGYSLILKQDEIIPCLTGIIFDEGVFKFSERLKFKIDFLKLLEKEVQNLDAVIL